MNPTGHPLPDPELYMILIFQIVIKKNVINMKKISPLIFCQLYLETMWTTSVRVEGFLFKKSNGMSNVKEITRGIENCNLQCSHKDTCFRQLGLAVVQMKWLKLINLCIAIENLFEKFGTTFNPYGHLVLVSASFCQKKLIQSENVNYSSMMSTLNANGHFPSLTSNESFCKIKSYYCCEMMNK